MSVQVGKKHNEGELEIAVLTCGPRIAVPVMQDESRKNGSPSNFNRISLRILGGKRVAELTLKGIEARPESYRIVAVNQAVLLVVPFKALKGLKIEKRESPDEMQTRSVDLLDGAFALVTYSAADTRNTETIEREVVPAGHYAVRVVPE